MVEDVGTTCAVPVRFPSILIIFTIATVLVKEPERVLLAQRNILILGVRRGILAQFASADLIGVQLGVGPLVLQLFSPLFLLLDFLDDVLGEVGVGDHLLLGTCEVRRTLR